MAEIIEEEKGKGGKKRAKKHPPHIDMTPMVDLMCLLIVFFMLTTAFNKAKDHGNYSSGKDQGSDQTGGSENFSEPYSEYYYLVPMIKFTPIRDQ